MGFGEGAHASLICKGYRLADIELTDPMELVDPEWMLQIAGPRHVLVDEVEMGLRRLEELAGEEVMLHLVGEVVDRLAGNQLLVKRRA